MAQPNKQQSPTNSERSSVESWIDVNTSKPIIHKYYHYHHNGNKPAVVPNSSLPMGQVVAPTVLRPHTPIHQIHPRLDTTDLGPGDEVSQPEQGLPVHPMMLPPPLDPAAKAASGSFYQLPVFGAGVAHLSQAPPGPPSPTNMTLASQSHHHHMHVHDEEEEEDLADMLSLLVGSTSLRLDGSDNNNNNIDNNDHTCDIITPVSAFVGDLVRSCCATERHALLRGHADCLISYHRAAEHWQLAREVRGRYTSGMNNVVMTNNNDASTSTPTHTIDTKQPTKNGATHHHPPPHPFGVIGERTCGTGSGGFQQQQRNNSILPSPDTPSIVPTSPHGGGFADLAMVSPCHGRNQMGRGTRFGPTSAGDFRPMISVAQQYNSNNYYPHPHTIDEPTDLVTTMGLKPQHPFLLHHHPLAAAATREHLQDERVALGYSPRYQGNIYLAANRCADIPDELNTSLFLVHLPAATTTRDVLAAVHALGPTGRVFALHINAPEPGRGNHGCAAKLVFLTRAAAAAFFARCHARPGGLCVAGRRAHVTWNRIKTAERPDLVASDASRVLLIAGPRDFVNPRTLTAFFRTKLEFQIDEVLVFRDDDNDGGGGQNKGRWGAGGLLPSPPLQQQQLGSDDAIVEYRFGSFRCQAQAAQMAISRMLPHVRCFFGQDPLAPEAWRGDEYTRRTCETYSEAAILDSLRV